MSLNVNLVRQAFLDGNPATLGALSSELFQRDPLCNDFRAVPPMFVTGVVGSTVATGSCVYLVSASGGTMTFGLADPSNPTKMPAVGIIEHKPTSTSAVIRPFAALGEYETSGLTAGSTYVVGSDGLLAKSGAGNYPAAGSIIQNVGVALSTTKLLMGAAAGNAAGSANTYAAVAASAALTASSTETTMGTYTIPANTLRAGSLIEVEYAGICTATNSTDTFQPKLYLGGGANILSTAALDATNNDLFVGSVKIAIRSTTVAFPSGLNMLGVVGSNHPKPVTHAALTHDATAAQEVKLTGTWSSTNAGNSCRLDVFNVTVRNPR